MTSPFPGYYAWPGELPSWYQYGYFPPPSSPPCQMVNMPLPEYDSNVTVAILEKNGSVTIKTNQIKDDQNL